MSILSENSAFDGGISPLLELVLPDREQAVIGYRPDPELAARIEELAKKSTEGELSDAERAEYAGYVRANKYAAILKRQAERLQARRPTG
ncbi:MAG: hypothetical protein IT424_11520 [Pirellulales bacterium]|nr:hypothetical protein [Pirellulales bacterium]